MGLTDSPYHTYHAVPWAKIITMGDRRDSDNPFSWDKLVAKLPGLEGYNFNRP